jgi:hypothetical protein
MIGFIAVFFTIKISYNSSQSMAKTRSIPYWTTSVFTSTVTDLVLIYESITSSAHVVRWLTPNDWSLNSSEVLNSLTNDECRMKTHLRITEDKCQMKNECVLSLESYVTSDGQSASLSWNKAPILAYDQIFITFWQLHVCWFGALSLTRGRVYVLQLRLALPAQSLSGPSPLGLVTIFYCLRFETSLFVTSYYSHSTPPSHGLNTFFSARPLTSI